MAREDLAPNFQLAINGEKLGPNIESLTSEVVVDYVDGAAWSAELTLEDDKSLAFIGSRAFQWGNDLDVWMGYGPKLDHMGRFQIAKQDPIFPNGENPRLSLKAYTADHRMMANSPDNNRRKKRGKNGRKSHPRVFESVRYDEAVEEVIGTYGFEGDIDPVKMAATSFNQIVGQKDFDFVRGVANIAGFLFWVDGDDRGKWTAHFRDPARIYDQGSGRPVQTEKLTFHYALGDASSLLEFTPEAAVSPHITRLKIAFKDPVTGKLIEEEIDDEGGTPDLLFAGRVDDQLHRGPDSAAAVRVFFGEFSIDTVSDRQFKDAADAARWAAQWFRKNREHFQVARGTVVGVESMRCFQEHTITGVGPTWSGDWYFTGVRHVMNPGTGYRCDFSARKVVR